MKNTGQNPKGTKRELTQQKLEKEVLVKMTKIMNAVVFTCAALICLVAVPASALDVNAQGATGENAAVVGTEMPGNLAEQNEEGLSLVAVAGGIISYVVTPWCTMEAVTLLNTGLGMIGGAVIPGYYDNPTKKEAVVLAGTH